MTLKKLLRYLAWGSLVLGASLTLGLLSFGGFFTLLPILPLALAAFGLSAAYEGEIYLQNIKNAWNKLFQDNYLQQQMANAYLLENFPDDTTANDCPQFYKNYAELLQTPHSSDQLAKEEAWFSKQLFSTDAGTTHEEQALRASLLINRAAEIAKLTQRRKLFHGMKAFSALAGVFMILGSSYLLVEAFTIIPFLAALPLAAGPFIIVPLAVMSGIAYAFLTYNAITDMITNDTLRKWARKIYDGGLRPKNIGLALLSVVLLSLAIGLTICTAGTWWTIAQKATPLFTWMGKIPGFIMGIINPTITGLSAVAFNLENSAESMEMIDDELKKEGNIFTRTAHYISSGWKKLKQRENWFQIGNPFRIL